MSDEEFQQAKRICERHGYQVRRIGGVEIGKPGFVINPDHVASIQVTAGVVRINWAAREAEVFDLHDPEKAAAIAENLRAHWS